jgi:transposase InsO family protein
MHLTLKKEAIKPPAKNFLQQQAKFDQFMDCFNHERPHQALNMKYPRSSTGYFELRIGAPTSLKNTKS